jgi:regulator of nonsense transcripts 3
MSSAKRPQERLKLAIRLLPPGLTEDEFKSALGEEWQVGKGRIDWLDFSPGKVTKSLAKYSKPSTAWIRVANVSFVPQLEEKLRQTSFDDAKHTVNDALFPEGPLLEHALNQKVPSNRKRVDPRMGTIDQDTEFKKFLESLTNPIQKPSADLESSLNNEDTKVTTTPLIEHLRAKKAAREARPSKGGKDAREAGKNRRKGKDISSSATTSQDTQKRSKTDRQGKQAVKVLTRRLSTSSNQSEQSSSSTPAQPERRRGPAGPFNIAAKIQKDLGLGPSTPRRLASRQQQQAEPTSSARQSDSKPVSAANDTPRGPRNRERHRTAKDGSSTPAKQPQPIILKKSPLDLASSASMTSESQLTQPKASSEAKQSSQSITNPPISPSLRVFLKHANASQGVNESILQAALAAAFGPVVGVDIDKRKGIAHADFEEASAATAAVRAGRLEVAQGAVQILPYRERGPVVQRNNGGSVRGRPGARGGRGGSGGGRGGRPSGSSASGQVAGES